MTKALELAMMCGASPLVLRAETEAACLILAQVVLPATSLILDL
jgi:hypothetical protein